MKLRLIGGLFLAMACMPSVQVTANAENQEIEQRVQEVTERPSSDLSAKQELTPEEMMEIIWKDMMRWKDDHYGNFMGYLFGCYTADPEHKTVLAWIQSWTEQDVQAWKDYALKKEGTPFSEHFLIWPRIFDVVEEARAQEVQPVVYQPVTYYRQEPQEPTIVDEVGDIVEGIAESVVDMKDRAVASFVATFPKTAAALSKASQKTGEKIEFVGRNYPKICQAVVLGAAFGAYGAVVKNMSNLTQARWDACSKGLESPELWDTKPVLTALGKSTGKAALVGIAANLAYNIAVHSMYTIKDDYDQPFPTMLIPALCGAYAV